MDIVIELPDMTDEEWDAHCNAIADGQKAIWQAKQARKAEVIRALNAGMRPVVLTPAEVANA